MAKTATGYARRSYITPASRWRPTTWLKIQATLPWLVISISVALTSVSPMLGLTTFLCGALFYMVACEKCPKPVWPRKVRNGRPEQAIWLGQDEYDLPIMLPVQELKRHGLLIGTTGSGKTTTIRTIAESIMKLGGGFCFIDGKADVTDTYAVLYEIVQKTDRLDDMLVLNFLNPHQSHSFNFLLYGDADFLAEVMTGFMKDAQGDQAYWQGKAKVLMKTILSCLVYKRDHPDQFNNFVLTVGEVRKLLSFQALLAVEADPGLPERDPVSGTPVKERLHFYLNELGPWQELKPGAARPSPAAQEVLRQHGLYVQQWGEPFDLLTGVFNPIFNTDAPDIDLVDVVTNSRIIVVLLPSLSYSLSTLRALGRMVLNTFKIALTIALGKDVEGDYKVIETEVRKNRPSVPFIMIPDEYGSYAVEGFDTILAQARSLGMGVVISVQELASLFKASETDAKRLVGNTNIKMIMKVEDTDTAEFIAKRAGEEFFMTPQVRGESNMFFETTGNFDGQYQYQRLNRLEVRDLTSLQIGEGYLIVGDDVRKYSTRYIPPEGSVKFLKLNKYVRRSTFFMKSKALEAIKKARGLLDRFMVHVYSDMGKFGIGIKEERVFKKFLRGKRMMFLKNTSVADMEPYEILHELHSKNYFQTDEEYGLAKKVVGKRIEYEKFTGDMLKEAKSGTFFNDLIKPSAAVNDYLRKTIMRLKGDEM
jgi:hypothetical protein